MSAAAVILSVAVSLSLGAKTAPAKAPSISGVVRFEGAVPTAKVEDRSSDPACGANAPDASLSVKDGKLANVLVQVVDAPKPKDAAAARAKPVVVEQSGCTYRPRVSAALDGQEVLIRNQDGTLHNVHAYLGKTNKSGKPLTAFNKAQTPGSQPISDRFKAADGTLSVKCDIHPWMQAWIVPVESPFFAVTGPDGAFEIDGLPPGTYKLVAWHETLGTQTQQITVPARGGASASFTFKPR